MYSKLRTFSNVATTSSLAVALTLACQCSRMEPAQEMHSFLRSYAGSHATEHIACVRAYTLYLVLRVQTSDAQPGDSARIQHQTLGIVLTKDGVLRVE